jgi:drug/metabolite transporter (DMT)-like permease
LLVLLSWLALSFEYIVITVIFNKSSIFGLSEAIGGFLSLNVGNLLVILWLRMLVVVPLMAVLGTRLYSGMWQEIRQFAQLKNWRLFVQVAISGGLRFMSELLLYLALGTISPGVALTIFFIYPIVITLLGWVRLGDRFSRFSFLRSLIILSVLVGFVLVTLPNSRADELSHLGISAAIGSALAFAFHLILSQTYAPKFNRIALSWINFVLILAFSSLSLAILPLPESWNFDVAPALWPTLLISCVVLGGTTLVNYLLNNIGSRMIGAGKASILGTTVPALTAILALVIIQQTMQVGEIFGMLLVTLGVAALSFEQWRRQTPLPQPAVRESK